MLYRLFSSIALFAATAALPGCSENAEQPSPADTAADPLVGLAIETATASEVAGMPIGTVPGVVTLPPEARVAVTAPYSGAAVRVYVIEGQGVRRGQALALVRSAEPVQIRGNLTRAESEVGVAEARVNRLTQLADEGIIAQSRADEAIAALAQARASAAEQRRLASRGGVGPDGMMTLSAPISGRVAHVGTETGGPVDLMEAPFVIEAEGSYQIEMQLPERLAKVVRPGMPVEILHGKENGERLAIGGKILAVSPSIDPTTRAVLARASIGAAPGIVAGSNVSVTIKGSGELAGVAVPSSAVTKIGGEDHVFVQDGKKYEARKVTVAATTREQVVISDGLIAGEVVAASSITELKAMGAE